MNFVIIVTAISAIIVDRSAADYTAAVVEFDATRAGTPKETLEYNLNEYIMFIETASNERAQIIVFPEYGLTSRQTEPADYAIEVPAVGQVPPFRDYVLQSVADAAREHFMYIVVNLLEKANNTKNETIYYNTNIVFDRRYGGIAAKYRKINLFKEPKITPGDKDQRSAVFDSDFGTTFGIITSSELLDYNPPRSILKNGSVTDVLLPSAWISYLPFYHSLSLQLGYVLANRVNLLAANLNNASEGISGSGIYGKSGTVYAIHISGKTSSRLLVATVKTGLEIIHKPFVYNSLGSSRPSSEPEINLFKALTYFTPSKYIFKQLDLTQSTIDQKLCDGSFCCYFNLNVSDPRRPNTEIYKLLAFQGKDQLDKISQKRRVCAIIACETTDVKTCGSRNVSASTVFSGLSVRSTVKDVPEEFYMPILMKTDLRPVFNTTYSDHLANGTRRLILETTREEQNVVVFAIVGRGGSSAIDSSFLLLTILTCIGYLFK